MYNEVNYFIIIQKVIIEDLKLLHIDILWILSFVMTFSNSFYAISYLYYTITHLVLR